MPYAPGQTTGFNSVSDYLGANQGTLDREAGDVNSLIGSELDSAKTAADGVARQVYGQGASTDYTTAPGYAGALDQQNKAQQDAALTKGQGGLQDLLGRTGHGQATAFDAQLLGSRDFGATRQRAETLHDYLDAGAKAAASHPFGGPIDPGRTGGGGSGATPDQPADVPGSPNTEGGMPGPPGPPPMPQSGGEGTGLRKRGNPLMGYL